MSKPPLPDDAVALLRKPNPAVIVSLAPTASRSPSPPGTCGTTAWCWSTWIRPQAARPPARRSAGELALLDENDWYTHVSIIGRIVELGEDNELTDIDRLSQHYLGKPYARRDRRRFPAWIEMDRWHGWGAEKDNSQPG